MKRIVSAGVLTAAFVLLAATVAFGKPSAVVLPELGSIAQIQLDLVKMDAERFDKGQLEGFLEQIQAAVPVARVEAAQVEQPEEDFILAFVDQDGNRKSFSFFCIDGTYYMETGQGDLFQTTDFMKEYLTGNTGWFPMPRGVGAVEAADATAITCALDTQYDTRYWLFCAAQKKRELGLKEEEVLASAKAELLWQYQLYQYAMENGLGIPEQQYGELTQGWFAEAKQQEGYASAEQEYESCGTTLEAHIRQSAGTFWRIIDTVYYMQYCFQEEFGNEGKDTVDGVAYDMAGNYANACMNRIMLSGCGSVDTTEFEKELEQAGQYWEEQDAPFLKN